MATVADNSARCGYMRSSVPSLPSQCQLAPRRLAADIQTSAAQAIDEKDDHQANPDQPTASQTETFSSRRTAAACSGWRIVLGVILRSFLVGHCTLFASRYHVLPLRVCLSTCGTCVTVPFLRALRIRLSRSLPPVGETHVRRILHGKTSRETDRARR